MNFEFLTMFFADLYVGRYLMKEMDVRKTILN